MQFFRRRISVTVHDIYLRCIQKSFGGHGRASLAFNQTQSVYETRITQVSRKIENKFWIKGVGNQSYLKVIGSDWNLVDESGHVIHCSVECLALTQ